LDAMCISNKSVMLLTYILIIISTNGVRVWKSARGKIY